MATFRFRATVVGADLLDATALDALHGSGCDDATVATCDGIQSVDFDREASTFGEAVGSAVRAIESAVPGARVTRVQRDDGRSLSVAP